MENENTGKYLNNDYFSFINILSRPDASYKLCWQPYLSDFKLSIVRQSSRLDKQLQNNVQTRVMVLVFAILSIFVCVCVLSDVLFF